MCSELSPPRISFSNDEGLADLVPVEPRRDSSLLDSNSDFEFGICSSNDNESSSADELFCNGVIVPVQTLGRLSALSKSTHRNGPPFPSASLPPLPPPTTENPKKETTKEGRITLVMKPELEQRASSKSFWGFKRSSSLNCDRKRSIVCSLPLLSRSNSTGSVPHQKKTTASKQGSRKQFSVSVGKSSSSSSGLTSSSNLYSASQKSQQKKNHGGLYGNNLWISPFLNIPPPYISKGAANIFGLGSLLRSGKEKKSRK